MSDAEQPRCASTHVIETFIGPTFEISRIEDFRCIRESGHSGGFHFGPPTNDEFGSYATWQVDGCEETGRGE